MGKAWQFTGEELAAIVPRAAGNVLLLGERRAGMAESLAAQSAKVLHVDLPFSMTLPEAAFDCVFLDPDTIEELALLLPGVRPLITVHGSICVTFDVAPEALQLPEAIASAVQELRLMPIRTLLREMDGGAEIALLLVSESYDPITHAQDLEAGGLPLRALSVLASLDELMELTEEQQGLIAAEKLRLLHGVVMSRAEGEDVGGYLARARREFQLAVHAVPLLHAAYREQASLLRRGGREDLAVRLLRSVNHVSSDPETAAMLETFSAPPFPASPMEHAPEWSPGEWAPRVLVITHDKSDYGMDSLYDGLCRVLGKERVVEFPWKGTLHGVRPENALNYPCVFEYPGDPVPPEVLEQELRDGRFDLILYADVVQLGNRDTVRRFLDAAPDLPLVIYDPWDDNHVLWPSVLKYLGNPKVAAYFKREMLAGLDYGANAFPLPFGYPDELVPDDVSNPRTEDLFWAGKRLFGTRALYLDQLASLLGRSLERTYSQDEYRRAIRASRMGLSLFGYGYDTVRYWELPAHGTMLLAERPPIRIPESFVEGESAVFFDDLPELEAKLAHCLSHPDEVRDIAQAGHAHFKRFHTTSARARQLLGRLAPLLGW